MSKSLTTSKRSYPVLSLFDDLESWINALSNESFWNVSGTNYPRLNVLETSTDLKIEASVPGLTKDDVEVLYEDGLLTVRGSKQTTNDKASEGNKYHVRELHKSQFSRTVAVPQDRFDVDKVNGKVENGLLIVSVPKKTVDSVNSGVRKITLS